MRRVFEKSSSIDFNRLFSPIKIQDVRDRSFRRYKEHFAIVSYCSPVFFFPSLPSLALRTLFISTFHDFCGTKKRYARNEEKSLVGAISRDSSRRKTLHVANNKLIHPIEMKFCAPHILIQCNISFVIPPDILRTIFCFTI